MNTTKASALKLAVAGAIALGTMAGTATAATATSDLSVTATVAANCTISTAAVAFGAYDPVSANASAALDGTGTVTVKCTNGSATTVLLGQGANAAVGSTDAAPARRLKANTADFLSYSLYSDTARSVVWGNDATVDVAHTGTGTATALTVYGRVAAGQNVATGSYADTVVATVSF